MRDRTLGVAGRRLRRYAREALAEPHPELEARPVRLVDVALGGGIDPRIREEHREHLLGAAVPHAESPRARPAHRVEIAEEGGAGAAPPLGEGGRRGQAGAAASGADTEVEVPGRRAGYVDGHVAVEEGDGGPAREAPLVDRPLDAGAEDHVAPVLLEALAEEGEEGRLRAVDLEILRARAVEVGLGHDRSPGGGPAPSPARCSARRRRRSGSRSPGRDRTTSRRWAPPLRFGRA